MPPRSKVVTMLPAHIRGEVERRMLEKGFSDYKGLAGWVRQQGYQISDDSLWRYGKGFQQQLAAFELAARQSRALVEVAPDHEGQLTQALTQIIEQKILSALMEVEHLKYRDMTRLAHAVAAIARATLSQRRWAEVIKARAEQQRPPQRGGLSPETSKSCATRCSASAHSTHHKRPPRLSPRPKADRRLSQPPRRERLAN